MVRHSTTQSQLAGGIASYGFSSSSANIISSNALEFAKSNAGSIVGVFIAGSSITLGTVEALNPDWPWKRKLKIAGAGGLFLVGIALVLIYFGIWGTSVKNEKESENNPMKIEHKSNEVKP